MVDAMISVILWRNVRLIITISAFALLGLFWWVLGIEKRLQGARLSIMLLEEKKE